MRHKVQSKRVNRDEAHLSAMLKNLATSLVLYEKVKTTKAKAKLVTPVIERLITTSGKYSTVNAMRYLNAYFLDKNASKKVVQELLGRYKNHNAGFVRLTNLGFRSGDAAPMVQIELI